MKEKEIQVINLTPWDIIVEYEEKLKDPNLSLAKRKTYETYLKNYRLRVMNMQEKQDAILQDYSEKQVTKEQPKKQQKKQTLTPKKIMIAAAFTALVATTGFTGFKIQNRIERREVFGTYNQQYKYYEIQPGDTLYSIANNVYEGYPEDIKKLRTVQDVVNEIQRSNHIINVDFIKYGTKIVVLDKYIPKEEVVENTKNK